VPVLKESVRAPAKVNLRLRIVGKRADGYHLIDSLMAPISLFDHLDIAVSHSPGRAAAPATVVVHTDSADIPGGADNLAHRAAVAFIAAAAQDIAVEIQVRKRIPIGSGLGGGSSDAAAVLLTLNRMLGFPLEIGRLAEVAAGIGADIPFFVYGCPARVTGIGEQVLPTALGASLHLVVCSDGYMLPTWLVYSHVRPATPSLTSESAVSNIRDFVEGRKPFSDLLVNDLEEAAAEIHPEVLSLKARVMEAGAQAALMSGSGSAVFGVCAYPQSAAAATVGLRRCGLWAEAVQTLELSPALGN
jgi:4-diphosphocytidyl-2-C-methyl-D-erythritol kinase